MGMQTASGCSPGLADEDPDHASVSAETSGETDYCRAAARAPSSARNRVRPATEPWYLAVAMAAHLPRLPRSLSRFATAAASAFVVVTAASSAWAAGNFTIKTTTVAESNGEWHIKVRIDLPRAPGMMHIPMRFTFSKEAVDERAIMSKGADPVHHRMVLDTPPKQIQSLDVDFADASGKVFKSTYFEFDLQRATGYFEAGEYLVALSGPDGDVGGSQKLTLTGDNPPVYRGAMDFGGPDPKKKGNIQSVSSGIEAGAPGAPGGGDGTGDDSNSAAPASTDVAPIGNGGDMVPSSAFNKTSEEEGVKDHPKGCGCVEAGLDPTSALGGGLALTAVGLAFGARRRSRREDA